ncbi:GH1 family beta-glucosidase [Sphingomonas sp.]|uniref:GH1 family beta-glucosidase n=1 Tax=Sphingomonas sp. TaxID=28214 RepID=UPI00286C1732|nr:GH1 family beta-glucosidase [Sphingomonas sp.]
MTKFPDGFLWGASTAAYQIEGSPLADGAGPSIWHRFVHTPGLTADGDTGDIACDHYNRYRDDVALMKALGLQAYRFSISWSRVFPEGTGAINAAGLDFYDRLVDALLAAGIQPLPTLYHWDLPAALDDRGGWLNPEIAHWFADYGEAMFRKLDGRVKRWATLNEPWVVTDGGYLHGALAPGHRNLFETPIASRNLMLAHGAAVQRYRAVGNHEIGLVVNLEPKFPATDSDADRAAANRSDAYMNRQYLDPAFGLGCPSEMAEIFGPAWRDWTADELALAAQPIDWLGVNYYTRGVMKHDDAKAPVCADYVRQPHATYTETSWEVFEQGLTDILVWVKDRYGDVPLYITENGSAFYDPPTANDGRVEDPLRVDYLKRHLRAVRAAIATGVDVRGYMTWSLFDNLEWSLGYSKRFGIVHVDFASQERTPKDSARYYTHVIASNGGVLDDPPPPHIRPVAE